MARSRWRLLPIPYNPLKQSQQVREIKQAATARLLVTAHPRPLGLLKTMQALRSAQAAQTEAVSWLGSGCLSLATLINSMTLLLPVRTRWLFLKVRQAGRMRPQSQADVVMIVKAAEAENALAAQREITARTKIQLAAAVEPVTQGLESGDIAMTAEIVGTTAEVIGDTLVKMTATMTVDMKIPDSRDHEVTVATVGTIKTAMTAAMIGDPPGVMITPRRTEPEDETGTAMQKETPNGVEVIVTRGRAVGAKKAPAGVIGSVTVEVPNGEDRKIFVFICLYLTYFTREFLQ